ncbi:alpha/beta hydrolase [Nitrospirillum sp. BR 11828]|uniref:alpha/beta hydrolase n=1 Tax=Nitrospirillum sp. BR 11828 TaxID=3104325 RepID=UPI002ACAA853|nr:alpha/beta fold hydrolase [Nitrospirillum sp. BR 11828]MDZ5649448.1 alpha/beta fold hydrolase [Nitrospirillum sp. BR 11828]
MMAARDGKSSFRLGRRAFLAAGAGVAVAGRLRPARAEGGRLTLHTASGRAVDVRTWIVGAERGRILFSHGALSAPWKYQSVIEAWGRAGYSVYAPLHVDSTDHPDQASFPGLASWPARIEDVRAVADHLGGAYIAAGHSYGALIALVLGGATPAVPEGVPLPLRDPRARVTVAFSPPGVGGGLVRAGDYATLAVPAIIQTGDRDFPPGSTDWRSHLAAYDEATPGGTVTPPCWMAWTTISAAPSVARICRGPGRRRRWPRPFPCPSCSCGLTPGAMPARCRCCGGACPTADRCVFLISDGLISDGGAAHAARHYHAHQSLDEDKVAPAAQFCKNTT